MNSLSIIALVVVGIFVVQFASCGLIDGDKQVIISHDSSNEVKNISEDVQKWNPWQRTVEIAPIESVVCQETSAIGDFPEDLFTQEQRQSGAIILHIFAAFYFFTLLAVVCNDYFLPTIECICVDLKISPDVAAATFMAVSGAIPEFFTNMISTFVTESQMGLGAVIGTLFFNTLGVAACAGIATIRPVQLLWYPLARDCLIFGINVATLTVMVWDGIIEFHEGLILSVMYVLYWIVLFQNDRIRNFVNHYIEDKWRCCRQTSYDLELADEQPKPPTKKEKIEPVTAKFTMLEEMSLTKRNIRLEFAAVHDSKLSEAGDSTDSAEATTTKKRKNLWTIPKKSIGGTIWWFYTWPIRVLTTCLIPNPKTVRKLYPLSFIMCIVFIGANSYLIFWMMMIIGHTFGIPDIVMGFTILCWGSCLPEAIACIIIIRRGSGGVGVSNSLGSNSMAILFSLGVPWFLRTAVDGVTNATVNVYSHGINYIIMSILLAILSLFVILATFRYRLKKTVGLVLLLAYGIFLTLSLLLELNIIFPSESGC